MASGCAATTAAGTNASSHGSVIMAQAPPWLNLRRGLPKAQWRCFRGRDRLGVSLWRKTNALLTEMLATFPGRHFYLKIDSDTLILPESLLGFLTAIRAVHSRRQPLYFGSNRISQKRFFCSGPRCLFGSHQWRALDARMNMINRSGAGRGMPSETSTCVAGSEASYAQGGAYGFDRLALKLLVRDDCVDRVAAVVADRMPPGQGLFEDEAVGLCMHSRRVRLVTCACFYDWGPCDINRPATCAADTPSSRLCHLPLSVHKLRQVSWYDGWWNLLSSREPTALAALRTWQSEALPHLVAVAHRIPRETL